MHVSISIFAAAVMVAALCFGAHADTSTNAPPTNITGRRVVYYGDLNLNANEDAKIMLQRIVRAARTACGGHATFSSYTPSLDHRTFEECRERAIQRTLIQLCRATVSSCAGTLERCADHIAPTTFMKMPWLLKLMSVRSSEKFVKLYPSPAFTCLPKWR